MSNTPGITPREFWTELLNEHLVGRSIKQVRYTSLETAMDSNWTRLGVELVLDNGAVVVIEQDNDASAPGSLSVWQGTNQVVTAPILEFDDHSVYAGTQV